VLAAASTSTSLMAKGGNITKRCSNSCLSTVRYLLDNGVGDSDVAPGPAEGQGGREADGCAAAKRLSEIPVFAGRDGVAGLVLLEPRSNTWPPG